MPVQVEHPPAFVPATSSMHYQRWYVAYTYPRHEKLVVDQLAQKSVESFLPTLTKTSRWKDRQVKIDVPLFPGYLFVRMLASERIKVVSIPSVIRILSFNEVPIPVSDADIEDVRLCINRGGTLQPHRFIAIGERVRVREGIFEGLEGFVVRHRTGCRLVVTVALIHQSVALEIEDTLLECVCPPLIHASTLPSRPARLQ
jgi:transcription antitermination factor NusG